MLFDFVLLSHIFLPGILLMIVLSNKIKLSFLEKILFGSVIWNYLFISSSTLLGLISNSVVTYFGLFQIISIVTAVASFLFIMKNLRTRSIQTIKPNLSLLPHLVVLLTLLILCFLLIYFHTLFVEWDALSYYIPSAKAILTAQGLTSQPYRLLPFFDSSPAIPAVYSWILTFSNIEYLYSVPIAYFALTLLVIFLICKKFFPNKGPTVPVLIFMSLPTVLVTISSRALYLDMPFVFFFLSTLYSATRVVTAKREGNSSTRFDYILLLMGLTLMCLTRIEFGLFLTPVAIATILFTFKPKYWQIMSAAAIGAVYYVREIRNIFLDQPSWLYYLQRLTPVVIVSLFVLLILRTVAVDQNNPNKPISKKFITATLLLTFPLVAYLSSNILGSGFVIAELPVSNSEIFKSIAFFNQISPSTATPWLELLRWDNLVTMWWLISPYLVPVTISISVTTYRLIKKKPLQSLFVPLLFFFAALFILWSILYCDPQPRRLYYFAPFIAIIGGFGLFEIKKYFSSIGFALRVPTYIITVTIYTLAKIGIASVNDLALFYDQLYLPAADVEFLVVCTAFFLLIFIPFETLLNRFRKNIKAPSMTSKGVILFVATINIVSVATVVGPIISATLTTGYQLRYQDYGGWRYYPEVVDYYNEHINDSGVTIGYYCNELITFANRSTIDLFNPIYGMPIYSIVEEANETEILNRIEELKATYFLIPEKGTTFYSLYEGLAERTAFGHILVDNPQFRALQSFKHATLYGFYRNYQTFPVTYSKITPWNYDHATNFTLISAPNLINFSATPAINERLSLMFIPASPLNLTETLWISIKSYNKATLFVTLFSNLTDRSTDFCSMQIEVNKEVRHPVFDLNKGLTSGDFTKAHVEGILVGLKTEADSVATIEIYEFSSVSYDNP